MSVPRREVGARVLTVGDGDRSGGGSMGFELKELLWPHEIKKTNLTPGF